MSEDYAPGIPEDFDSDFNIEDDYKPEPLCAKGNYKGNTTKVFFGDNGLLAFQVTLEGNEGFCSDGETPIDGMQHTCRVWLPSPADREILSANGKGTKFQSKVNMMARFAKRMQLNMNTMDDIRQAVTDADWIGLPCLASLGISEWPEGSGEFRNEVNGLTRLTEEG